MTPGTFGLALVCLLIGMFLGFLACAVFVVGARADEDRP